MVLMQHRSGVPKGAGEVNGNEKARHACAQEFATALQRRRRGSARKAKLANIETI